MDIIGNTKKRGVYLSSDEIERIMNIRNTLDLEILSLSPLCVEVKDISDIIKLSELIDSLSRPLVRIILPCGHEDAEIGVKLYKHNRKADLEKYDTDYATKCLTYNYMIMIAHQFNFKVRDRDTMYEDLSYQFYQSPKVKAEIEGWRQKRITKR